MQIRTQRVVSAAAFALACSCSASTQPSSKADHDSSTALSALHALQSQQAARIEELEARLSLLEADARQARNASDPRPSESVRIGESTRGQPPAAVSGEVADAVEPGKRPRLKLYGRHNGEITQGDALPAVPVVAETLPVAPLPTARPSAAAPRSSAPAATTSELASYQAGLRFVRERRFDDALSSFDAFIAADPEQTLVGNALYWRGEARYAKREYARARGEFEAVLARFPRNEKAADALLKLALCWRQLGSEEQARGAFRRLRTEYPNSQAATIAAREGAT